MFTSVEILCLAVNDPQVGQRELEENSDVRILKNCICVSFEDRERVLQHGWQMSGNQTRMAEEPVLQNSQYKLSLEYLINFGQHLILLRAYSWHSA